MAIQPVILSGGSGTRLWPLSRELYPKQLLALVGEQTMLQQTVQRLDGLDDLLPPLVVCNHEHRFMVAEQLRQIDVAPQAIILEPVARNTAPAVAIAALAATADTVRDPLLLVLPADHVVARPEALHQAIRTAVPAAEAGHLVTFGIAPGWAETGYGYIRAGAATDGHDGVFAVSQFVEKPDRPTAESYLEQGNYYWNSGMFLLRASVFIDELQRWQPAMLEACRAAYGNARSDLDFLRLDSHEFQRSPSDSIDYAVMEKTAKAAVVPLQAGWNDVGNWAALYEVNQPDANGNVSIGDVSSVDTHNCYIYAGHRLVATVGVDDMVVVETADTVFVAPRQRAHEVKSLVASLRKSNRNEVRLHRAVYRPWGSCDSIDEGERYQVKRLTIKPGASQSLQLHRRRAEHWVVVRGRAVVTCDEEQFELGENQSTYIPVGSRHRIHNPGSEPLELIEIQTGTHISEDDIQRFDDHYGRVAEEEK